MWLWAALGWCVLAVVVAAAAHRLRRSTSQYPPEVASFLLRFETELAKQHPDVPFMGMLADRFACVLCVDGQETPVGLHEAFRHAEAFPDSFARMVARLVADIREVGLDRVEDFDFAAAAPLLMPQVRSRVWLDEQGTFGDAGLVHTPLSDELVVVYVIDDPTCMVFVCRRHLRSWRKQVADLYNLSLGNLRQLGRAGLEHVGSESVLLRSGDGFDATRLLLLEQQEGLLVAVPDRDTLWVGPEAGQSLEQLMATTQQIAEQSPHPVSPHLFRVTDGRLQPVRDQG